MATTKVYLTSASGTTYTIPNDFGAPFSIEAIGGGGGGGAGNIAAGGHGGGGGAYAKITDANITLTKGQSVWISIPAATTGNGGQTWLNKNSNAAPGVVASGVLAKGGSAGGSGYTGGVGGGSGSVGSVVNNGGDGGAGATYYSEPPSGGGGGGGGGAGGMYSAGNNGTTVYGSDGGAGGRGDGTYGGAGGASYGAAGSPGAEWTTGKGSGGGGAGGLGIASDSTSYGGGGGAYGGGGGGDGNNYNYSVYGGAGLIVITYTITTDQQGSALLAGSGGFLASAFVAKWGNALLSGGGSLTAAAGSLRPGVARLNGTADLICTLNLLAQQSAAFAGVGALKANSGVARASSALLAGASELFVGAGVISSVQATTLTGVFSFTSDAFLAKFSPNALFAGAGGLSVDSYVSDYRYLSAVLSVDSSLSVHATMVAGVAQTFESAIALKAQAQKFIFVTDNHVFSPRGHWFPSIGQYLYEQPGSITFNGAGGVRARPLTAFIIGPRWPSNAASRFEVVGGLSCEASALYLFTDPLTPGILPDAGEQVLWPQATGLEKSLATTDAYRLMATYAEIIRDQWDPYAISRENLPFLAWAMGATLWESIWNEGQKRYWTDIQLQYKALRGTPRAYEMALGMSGYNITDTMRPPEGFWLSPDLSKAEWDAWVRQMPELRIYYAPKEGTRGLDEFFLDGPDDGTFRRSFTGYADADALGENDGFALYGRYAIVRRYGVDTPAHRIDVSQHLVSTGTTDFEQVSTNGLCSIGFIIGEDFLDDNIYFDYEDVEPKIYTVQLDRTYNHSVTDFTLTSTIPDLDPVKVNYETNSDVGDGSVFLFNDGSFYDDDYTGIIDREDGGGRLLADSIYLYDPDVAAAMTEGISFLDKSRLGIPTYYAEIMVDLHGQERLPSAYVNDMFLDGADFFSEEDTELTERALRAVVDAKALRDTIAVSFATVRPLQMGDFLTRTSTYGEWISNPL